MKKRKTKAAALLTACLMLGGLTACGNSNSGHTHRYGEWIDEIPATCTAGGTLGHYHCDGCDKDFDAQHALLDGISIDPKGHTYATTLTYTDDAGHYYAATCEHTTEKKGFTSHTMVTAADGKSKKCECGYEESLITELARPADLEYENYILTFGEVENATSYSVEFTVGETTVKTFNLTEPTLNVRDEGLPAGAYTVKVTAKRDKLLSESATLDVTLLAYDGDVILEAENALLSLKHYSADKVAHGGGYALGIDDCGQGLYFRYFAYEAGERDVDIAYSTANAGSFMAMHLNGTYVDTVTFEENTGWFGDSKKTATASVKLTFAKGWNELYLVKDGTGDDTPAWGGNAQIDYIKVHGSGNSYAAEDYDKTVESYRLEAECADWHYANADQRPINWPNKGFSQNYGLGEMNAEGDGVKFTFKVEESGVYLLQLAYSGDASGTPVTVSVNGGERTAHTLTGAMGAWDNVKLDETYLTAELTAGEWQTVDFARAAGDGIWLTVDYLLVTKIDHAHVFTAQNTDERYLVSAAKCTDKAVYRYSCTECGEAGSETFEYGTPNGHTFAETLSYDDDAHYYAATCGHATERKDEEAHTLVDDAATNTRSCSGCDYSAPLVSELATPTGLAYSDGAFTFNAVANATSYAIVIKKGETSVHTATITETNVNVGALSLTPGKYVVSVTAKCANISSEAATAEINVLVIDGDVILEAEDAILNPNHYSADVAAHGGAYALAFDNCGQGMYFRYYAYEAGARNVEVVYSTGAANSYMNFHLNGVVTKVLFSENTNWFGDSHMTATATVNLTFAQGWNEFYLIKDGVSTDSPEYGGWAQIDYIKVRGSGKSFDSTAYDLSSNSYRLEAECAQWHWQNAGTRPTKEASFSVGYYCGSMYNAGDGVKFTFKVAESGTYKIQLAYGGGGDTNVNYQINNGEVKQITLAGSTAWDNVVPGANAITVELTAGETVVVDFLQAGAWYVPDYLLVTKVEA